MKEVLEWSAFALGTIGTIFWAAGFKWGGRSIEGWFWLGSSLLWILFASMNNHAGLAARDLLGVALYVFGIFKSFQPAVTTANVTVKAPAAPLEPIRNCPMCNGDGVHQLMGPGTTTCQCTMRPASQT
jgi:hypothetical protein